MANTLAGYLSYTDAAAYLRLSRKTLERAVAANAIPYVRDPLTGRVRFHQPALDKWMAGRAKR